MITSQGVKAIIRPPRAKYNFKELPPSNEIPNFGKVQRTSIAFYNLRKMQMFGSFYSAPKPAKGNPCVVYMHGNASNQLEGRFAVSLFIPVGVNVFCFDFAGCGCSEGDYITLGHYETQDAVAVIDILQRDFHCEKIALWGRSMGAVTSLIVASTRKDICSCVVDSPFSSLHDLCLSIAKQKNIPNGLVSTLLPSIREKIMQETNFDIEELKISDLVEVNTTPTIFIHGSEDDFIPVSNTETLFEICGSKDKKKFIVKGGHNDDRPEYVIISATEFVCHYFGIEIEFVKPEDDTKVTTSQGSNQHFSNIDQLLEKQ